MTKIEALQKPALAFPDRFFRELKKILSQEPYPLFEVDCKRFAAALVCYIESGGLEAISLPVLLCASGLLAHAFRGEALTPARLEQCLNAANILCRKMRD